MEITIWCNCCKTKTLHKLVNLGIKNLEDEYLAKFMCTECVNSYHEGILEFKTRKQKKLITDKKTIEIINNYK